MSDARRLLLIVLSAAWVMVFGYSFIAYANAPYEGAGFPDGLNKPAVYLGWQAIAGLLAIAVFGVGRGWPKGSAIRWTTALPSLILALQAAVILGVLGWHDLL